jgi:dsRNA-specific ribonuclease
MSDTMEAIMGAVVEDGGQEALREVMQTLGIYFP